MGLKSFVYNYYNQCSFPKIPKFPAFLDILQYIWLTSHAITLFGTLVCLTKFGVRGSNSSNVILYDIVVYSTVVTYSIVTYRRYCLLIGNNPPPPPTQPPLDKDKDHHIEHESLNPTSIPLSEVLKTENAHLLAFALLWLTTFPNIIKVLPFTIYSFLNLGNYLLNDAFPEYQFSSAIKPLMEYLENPLLIAAAHLDGLIFIILSKEWYVSGGSGYAIVLYSLVWGLRIESSEASRCSLYTLLTVVDYFVFQDYNPICIQNLWIKIKKTITVLVPLTTFDKEEISSMYNYIDRFLPSSSNNENLMVVEKKLH